MSTVASGYVSCKGGVAAASSSGNGTAVVADKMVSDQFPAGLKVLVVDDDTTCLRILEKMLRRCSYNATVCSQATTALNLLRENKGCFDVVLSDVHMPDMDGYKLLEHVGLEMDLPVIMMSADGRTSAVMRGIRHGACDYLIKPIREEELKNIWQHVARKKWNENKELEHSGSLEDDRQKRVNDEPEYASSVNEGTEGTLKGQRKRSSTKEEDDSELENDDPSASKKPRVVWSVELHQQFVSAVNQLGLDKAVPKRILELMNVPGLTRENVASHLQKFRLYLKRLSGVPQQGGISGTFGGFVEPNVKLGSHGRFEIQALAASGQIPPQTLAVLHAELLGRPTGNLGTGMDQPSLLHASSQGPKHVPVEHGVAFGQPLGKCQTNIFKQFSQPILSADDISSRFGAWPSSTLGVVGSNNNLGGLSNQNGTLMMDILPQQQRQHQQKQPPPQQIQQQSLLSEPNRPINVQPSCLVVPSQSAASFQAGSPASVNQSCSYNRSSLIDYSILSPQSNNSGLNAGHISNVKVQTSGILCGYLPPGPNSTLPNCSLSTDDSTRRLNSTVSYGGDARQLPGLISNIVDIQGSYGAQSGEMIDQGPLRNHAFVGKGTSIPSRFAVGQFESSMNNLNPGKVYTDNNGYPVKQEPSMDLTDNGRVGISVLQQVSSNDLMSVFTK
ncbi:hypothetical protein UlMin_040657 [Ulmus minor]